MMLRMQPSGSELAMGVSGNVTAYFLLNGNVTFDTVNPQVS